MQVKIDRKKCNKCFECLEVCPEGVLGLVDGWPSHVYTDKCKGCATCLNMCPEDAISVIE